MNDAVRDRKVTAEEWKKAYWDLWGEIGKVISKHGWPPADPQEEVFAWLDRMLRDRENKDGAIR